MNIPWTYYFEYWLKNSLMALVTGFLISFIIPPFFAAVPFFGLIVVLIYQLVICRHFWGKRRGDFEFSSKESLIRKRLSSLIRQYLGIGEMFRFKLDSLNNIVTYGWDVHKKLLEHSNNEKEMFHFYLNHIAADLSRKEGDLKKERNYLLNAITSCPDELITNFRLAVTFEREGRSEESIEYYKKALVGLSNSSTELKEFINRQITRVIEKGPKKNPPMPGLRFMSW
jgi:tetratricopeptide (TPR) repeat protein